MLRVGVVTHDGFIDPQTPVKRAIAWVKEVLSSDTNKYIVDMIDLTIHGASDAWFSIKKMYWPDGGKVTKDGILSGGEPIHPALIINQLNQSITPIKSINLVNSSPQSNQFQ
jgi:amidase